MGKKPHKMMKSTNTYKTLIDGIFLKILGGFQSFSALHSNHW